MDLFVVTVPCTVYVFGTPRSQGETSHTIKTHIHPEIPPQAVSEPQDRLSSFSSNLTISLWKCSQIDNRQDTIIIRVTITIIIIIIIIIL